LAEIPATLGSWRQVSRNVPLEAEIEDALGTKQYIFRTYVDERVVGRDEIDRLRAVPSEDFQTELNSLQAAHPEAVVNFAVTYYTGLVDTVAHIPDRCYVADGYEPRDYQVEQWPIDSHPVKVRFINFEDQIGYGKQVRSVVYFFQVNGRFTDDPLDVRVALQDLSQKYGYYAKIEAMDLLTDRNRSAAVLTEFLQQAMPHVRSALPAWPPETTPQTPEGPRA
jgi:hypothetical protein